MPYSKILQGWCSFKDKQDPDQITLRKDIRKIHIHQVSEYSSELLRMFRLYPNHLAEKLEMQYGRFLEFLDRHSLTENSKYHTS